MNPCRAAAHCVVKSPDNCSSGFMASSTVVEMQLNHYKASSTEACPGRKAHSWKPWVGRRLASYSHLVEITLPRISKFLPSLPSNLLLHNCTNVRHSWKHLEGVGVLGEEMNPCLTTAWTHTHPPKSHKKTAVKFLSQIQYPQG